LNRRATSAWDMPFLKSFPAFNLTFSRSFLVNFCFSLENRWLEVWNCCCCLYELLSTLLVVGVLLFRVEQSLPVVAGASVLTLLVKMFHTPYIHGTGFIHDWQIETPE